MKKILIGIFICVFLVAGVFALTTINPPHKVKLYEVKDTQLSCDNICQNKTMFCLSASPTVVKTIPNTNYRYETLDQVDCGKPANHLIPEAKWTIKCNCFK